MSESIKQKSLVGVGWSAIERFSVQGVNFLIQLVLARLLTPTDYGVVGMLAIFMQVAQTFIDSGFANALIQKKDCTQKDYSTVFYFNLGISSIIYILFFFVSPFVANFYRTEILTDVMRVLSLTLVINALSIVQKTILIKKVDFKTQSAVSLLSAFISGTTGIIMAYRGYGVWALCGQQIVNSICQFVFLQIFVRWRPSLAFSKESFNTLFFFGSKLLLSRLIHTIYKNLYTIVIGRTFSAESLGQYNRAEQFADFPSSNIGEIITRVAYPILSKIQDENDRLIIVYRTTIRYASLIIFPLMIGLLVLAKPLILLLLTEKWEGIIILLQILCLDFMLSHISTLNLNILYVKGRSDLALKLEIIKKTIAIIILVLSIPFGVIGMCWGKVVYGVIATVLNTTFTKRLVGLSFFTQCKDFMPYMFMAAGMGIVVFLTTLLNIPNILQLIIGFLAGVSVYLLLLYIFDRTTLKEVITMAKENVILPLKNKTR